MILCVWHRYHLTPDDPHIKTMDLIALLPLFSYSLLVQITNLLEISIAFTHANDHFLLHHFDTLIQQGYRRSKHAELSLLSQMMRSIFEGIKTMLKSLS